MYTKQHDYDDFYMLLDPQGDYIVGGMSEEEADALLSHLNR